MLFGTQSTPYVDIQRQLQTGADQITSQAVVKRVKSALQSSKSPDELAAAVSAAPGPTPT